MSVSALEPAPTETEGISPIYRSERVTVYHADSLDVLPGLATESVHVVVTDPPYGNSYDSCYRAERFGPICNDTPADRGLIRQVLSEAVRVVGQRRHLYVFGPSDVLEGLKVSAVTELVWSKMTVGFGDLRAVWGPAHEPISFAVSAYRHGGQAGRSNLPVRMRKGSVLSFPRPTGRNVRHPNEKPVGLLRELLESSTRLGETVLDPFCGSGSTGVAALLSGRRSVLVESDRRWAEMAVERVSSVERLVEAAEQAAGGQPR